MRKWKDEQEFVIKSVFNVIDVVWLNQKQQLFYWLKQEQQEDGEKEAKKFEFLNQIVQRSYFTFFRSLVLSLC